MSNSKNKIVILEESVAKSVLKDLASFLMFAALMWFNHAVLSGSGIVDAIFIVIVTIWISTKGSARVFEGSEKDAIEWLKKKEA